MSISNHNVNVKASTPELEAQWAEYRDALEAEGIDDAYAEWLESGMELIDDELGRREDYGTTIGHADSPSLQDRGINLGSYAS